jgi:hypothetical protein
VSSVSQRICLLLILENFNIIIYILAINKEGGRWWKLVLKLRLDGSQH